jgi:hypothetical protein
MKKSVWVIEQGSYSDYRVVGVFTSKAKAEQIAEALRKSESCYDAPEVAEWPLDPAVAELNAGLTMWNVLMLKDGTVERAQATEFSAYSMGGEVNLWERTKAPAYARKGIPDALHAIVWAKDKKHAIKSVNEMRAQWIATGKWK